MHPHPVSNTCLLGAIDPSGGQKPRHAQAGKYWTPGACLVRVAGGHIGWSGTAVLRNRDYYNS